MGHPPSASDLDRILAANHADPHSVLGPHLENGTLVIRAFRPDAAAMWVRWSDGSEPQPMVRAHSGGLFELRVEPSPPPGAAPAGKSSGGSVRPPAGGRVGLTRSGLPTPAAYQLEVSHDGWSRQAAHDPYAFETLLGEIDLYLAAEGKHWQSYRRLGARPIEHQGVRGTAFAVCAPSARRLSVVGDFNQWDGRLHTMRRRGQGLWELFIPGVEEGTIYKFEIIGFEGQLMNKADPMGRAMELRPHTASKVVALRYVFRDQDWMERRARTEAARSPMSIYEVHLGSWRHAGNVPQGPNGPMGDPANVWLSYRQLGEQLPAYVADLGFTHIELMPVMEHPLDASWGYQVGGYYAPTARYGTPDDFRYFVDRCHHFGVGVILDWVPAHFPRDAAGLGRFDGTCLYEHRDPRQGEHRQWGTYIFNYGRAEVRNFLLSNALYWLDLYHIDGLRADAVASMLYLDYGANDPGEWVPNRYGGHENIEAIEFLRELSELVHTRYPGAMLMAEESTAFAGVTHSPARGGLGFDFKWNMGWMHDTLRFFSKDPVYRSYHHNNITFGLWYAWAERFLLPLSHDEVVHLKGSMLSKMSGDRWQQFANLRSLYAHMWAHPGKKLLFMGSEIGQWAEWSEARQIDWACLNDPAHAGIQRLVRDLNRAYRTIPALWEADHESRGFRWIDANDYQNSVISYLRFPVPERAKLGSLRSPLHLRSELRDAPYVVCVGNFTPRPRYHYRIGVPFGGRHAELINTDASIYGGSGLGNLGGVWAQPVPCHGYDQSLDLTLPPLSMLWLVPEV